MWVWAFTRPGMRTLPPQSISWVNAPAGRVGVTEAMVSPSTTTKASSSTVAASSISRARQWCSRMRSISALPCLVQVL